jgi:hypothetical protein
MHFSVTTPDGSQVPLATVQECRAGGGERELGDRRQEPKQEHEATFGK